LRAAAGQAVEPSDPLLNRRRPVLEGEPTGKHGTSQEGSGSFLRRCTGQFSLEDEVAKERDLFADHALPRRIERHVRALAQRLGEQLPQPGFLYCSGEAQDDVELMIAMLDLVNLRRHK